MVNRNLFRCYLNVLNNCIVKCRVGYNSDTHYRLLRRQIFTSSCCSVVQSKGGFGKMKHSSDVDVSLVKSKYKGCMVSSLLGDCFGAPYEQDYWDDLPSTNQLSSYFQQLVKGDVKVPFKSYTDDTAMTYAVAKSLVKHQAFDAKDMAKGFVQEFFSEPYRGYGRNVVDVFRELRRHECESPFSPAQYQFDGQGSYGNGGSMRVAPVALFCYNNVDALIDTARQQAQITHANRDGYNGAVLQCLAVHLALRSDPRVPLDRRQFVDTLISQMRPLEAADSESQPTTGRTTCSTPYLKALERVSGLLESAAEAAPKRNIVVDKLGHDISALRSVPTAIYCFLQQLLQQDLQQMEPVNGSVLDTIQYAISLGGDTDTVATMAAAIAGAFWGCEGIPPTVYKYCERPAESEELALQLYDLVHT